MVSKFIKNDLIAKELWISDQSFKEIFYFFSHQRIICIYHKEIKWKLCAFQGNFQFSVFPFQFFLQYLIFLFHFEICIVISLCDKEDESAGSFPFIDCHLLHQPRKSIFWILLGLQHYMLEEL